MNAVVALCHFCDTHGPRNMLCTQVINKCESKMLKEAIFAEVDQCPSANRNRPDHRATVRCKSCQSMGDNACLVSYDEENEIYYISSESPRNAFIFHLVRTACLRSLYNEQTQGKGGSILFGHGNCMIGCSTFFLRDLHSRGHTRLYSLQLILNDKFMSTSTWSYVIDQFNRIAEQLVECSDLVFEEESAVARSANVRTYAYALPSNLAAKRSLADITALPDIATRIHSWFTWILRSLPQLMTEEILEGQATEDQLVEIESREDKNEHNLSHHDNMSCDRCCNNLVDISCCSQNDTKITQGPLDAIKCQQDKHTETIERFDELRFLMRRLGSSKFKSLIYHVVVGNQIVVRCDNQPTTENIIRALEILIPRGCCQPIPYSLEYVESFRVNLLGMPFRRDGNKHSLIEGLSDNICIFLDVHVRGSITQTIARSLAYWAKVRTNITTPTQLPKIVTHLSNLIGNIQITSKAALSELYSLKQDWLLKSKIFYAFSRYKCNEALSQPPLLKSLNIDERDMSVIRFWQKGISHYQRQQILQIQAEQTRHEHMLQISKCDQQSIESLCSRTISSCNLDETARRESGEYQSSLSHPVSLSDEGNVFQPNHTCQQDFRCIADQSNIIEHRLMPADCFSLVQSTSTINLMKSNEHVAGERSYDWDFEDSIDEYDFKRYIGSIDKTTENDEEKDDEGDERLTHSSSFEVPVGPCDRPCTSLHDAAVNFGSSFGCCLSFLTEHPSIAGGYLSNSVGSSVQVLSSINAPAHENSAATRASG